MLCCYIDTLKNIKSKYNFLNFPATLLMPENLQYLAHQQNSRTFPASNYMLKVNNRNTRTRCETYSKLPIKTPEVSPEVLHLMSYRKYRNLMRTKK